MTGSDPAAFWEPARVGLESHGVTISVSGPAGAVERAVAQMGRAARPVPVPTEPMVTAEVEPRTSTWTVFVSGYHTNRRGDGERAADRLAQMLHSAIARECRDKLFIHAGTFAWDDRLVIVPGRSGAGKSTLVKAALEAGATYYSDEYAVLDEGGLVHPYARQLVLREGGRRVHFLDAADLGAVTAARPVGPAAVVVTEYNEGATWEPVRVEGAQAALPIIANTVLARGRSEDTTRRAAALARRVPVLVSPRGQADDTVVRLREWLDATAEHVA